MDLYAGIEAGGTKFVCAIGNEQGQLVDEISFPTAEPSGTLDQAISFIKRHEVKAIGLGAFGPLCLNPQDSEYGRILKTPKLKWQNFNVLQYVSQAFPTLPIGFDTDVAVAALGEQKWGAAQGIDDFIYLTVGTGIGGGVVVNNQIVHGLTHPELGHISVNRSEKELADFHGVCPIHGDCLEGMASGSAINARWRVESSSILPSEHVAWDIESDYLADALKNYILIVSPKRIILGGGVMKQSQLFPMVRKKVQKRLGGYISHKMIDDDIDSFIVPPRLSGKSGVLGAIVLAMRAVLARDKSVVALT
ncbi:MAG: ROK family protein [Francisellaceae bacterium]